MTIIIGNRVVYTTRLFEMTDEEVIAWWAGRLTQPEADAIVREAGAEPWVGRAWATANHDGDDTWKALVQIIRPGVAPRVEMVHFERLDEWTDYITNKEWEGPGFA